MTHECSLEPKRLTEEETWNEFQEQKKNLERRLNALRVHRTTFSETPETREYLREKSRLEDEIAWLQNLRREFERVRRFYELVGHLQVSLENVAEFLQRQKERLENLFAKCPCSTFKKIREQLVDRLKPAPEIVKEVARWNEEEISRRSQQIVSLASQYRARKQHLRQSLEQCEAALRDVQRAERAWITASRATMEWYVKRFPEQRQTTILRYAAQHLDEVADLLPNFHLVHTIGRKKIPGIGRPHGENITDVSPKTGKEEPAEDLRPWHFVLTNEARTRDYPLPLDPENLRRELARLLAEIHCLVPVDLLIKKLEAVTRMTVQQRQQLHKLADLEPCGWKIIRMATFRTFLDVDEQQQVIRFLVRHRREAYE